MKKKLTLTESQLVKVINRIVESYNDYADEDYVEVFFHYFRPWIKKNHGDDVGNYPLSYLVKKYLKEFVKDFGMDPENDIYEYRNSLSNVANIGKILVKKGKHTLPSLRSQEKFTEKFKKPLQFFVNELKLPDFIEINFRELETYRVDVIVNVNWVGLITSSLENAPNIGKIKEELKNRIENYLGVEIGNPIHGHLVLNLSSTNYIGVDEWVKNTLNKQIKKEIRNLPRATILHAIKFETNSNSTLSGELKLSFKSWSGKNDFVKSVKELLQMMGYNTKILKVVT